MVKIAIAGGSSGVAREIVDTLVSRGKHEIILLSRKTNPGNDLPLGVSWTRTDYENVDQLVETLRGVHTVLCFIVTHLDPENRSQRNLIDAAVQAGVKRFAPSEWSCSSFHNQTWSAGKTQIREYLFELNKDNQILEYTLFQPGLFIDYLAYPYNTTNHISLIQTPIDFENRRILTVKGREDARIVFTTAQDLANVVAQAIEYEGKWPVVGGIRGSDLTVAQLISLGERIRGSLFKTPRAPVDEMTKAYSEGGTFAVDRLDVNDLKAGKHKASWLPQAGHPAFSRDQFEALSGRLVSGILLGISAGEFEVSDEWNRLLPSYRFVDAESFLKNIWHKKT